MATETGADVPDPNHPRIVADDRFGGEPRIDGRRITVLDVFEGVRSGTGAMTPEEFADAFRLDLSDVYAALAYYHDHEAELDRHRRARNRASRDLRDRIADRRPPGVHPDG